MEKAKPFGFRDFSPEITLPEITLPPITVKVDAPVVNVELPESKGWKFVIHKRKDGDIEMTARPL